MSGGPDAPPTHARRLVMHGAAGRMGQAIVRLIAESPGVVLVAAMDREDSPALGKDAGDLAGVGALRVAIRADLAADVEAHAIVDFTSPRATLGIADVARERGFPLVIGTTGLDSSALAAIERAAREVPVVLAPNTSVGVTVLCHLAQQASRLLGEGFDAEIVEMHHSRKIDAPSGTALRLADAVLDARGLDRSFLRTGRDGKPGPRTKDEVGVLALRGGDVIGDHTLIFAGEGERVELSHKATDRALFARGAVRAARWVSGRSPGLYDMRDVLGLR